MESINKDKGAQTDGDKTTVLNIMVDRCSDIEHTVSLVKKEIAEHVGSSTPTAVTIGTDSDASNNSEAPVEQFQGLNNLLTDSRVRGMIKSAAGEETTNIIDEALGAIKSSKTSEDKKQALTGGLRKLHTTLEKSQSVIQKDPAFNLCLSLVGLTNLRRLS